MEAERLRHVEATRPPETADGTVGLDSTRQEIDSMLQFADQLMDSLGHLDAEDYLQQNQQRGGQ